MDVAQFHAGYDAFPEPLLLQTAEGGWLTNPAAEALCLTQTDYDLLNNWNGDSSLWLAGRFFYVQGHRTPDGLFLLLHASAFLSTAAINLSTQLRQRLTSAFSALDALTKRLSNDDTAVKEEIAVVNRSLHQLLRIATQLDRCTDEELPCNKTCLDLIGWLRRLSDEIQELCDVDNHAALHIDYPSVSLVAYADPHLLDYMVTSLISNAIKASTESQAQIFLSLKKQGEQAILSIRSEGKAVSPAILTDPLWNQPTLLQPGRGLGLGLPIAQRIAALHGGTLMVSPIKAGTQMTFSLPLTIPEGLLSSPAPRVEASGGFSMVRIVLSDALPAAAFHPDFHPQKYGS